MNSAITSYDINYVLEEMGAAAFRLNAINACEANAGNISVTIPTTDQVAEVFPNSEPFQLPTEVPALRGRTVLISGSQQRLREITTNPLAIVGAIIIDENGNAVLRSAPQRQFLRPTSEANSHLAVHNDYIDRTKHAGIHAVVHAHAPNITTLSHSGPADSRSFSQMLMRWEPELVVHVPHGIGFLPYEVPGSQELEQASVAALRVPSIITWAKHGVLARSEKGPLAAVDLIDFMETGARFEIANRQLGNVASGLTDAEIAEIIARFGVLTSVY